MNNKFLKIATFIFVSLGLIVAIPWLSELFNTKKPNPMDKTSVNLAQFSQKTVSKISIKKGDNEKVLAFSNNKWLIGNDEADENKIKQLFQDLADLKVKEMVSENQDNWGKFEVTPESGLRLTLTQDGKEQVFFVGKAGTASGDFYLRKEGIKNVYLVNGNLRDKLEWDASKWKKTNQNEEKK